MTGFLVSMLVISAAIAAAATYDAAQIGRAQWDRSAQPRGMWLYGPLASVPICGMGGVLGIVWFTVVRNRVLRARPSADAASLERILEEFRTRATAPPAQPDAAPLPATQPGQAQSAAPAPTAAALPPPAAPAAWLPDPTGRHQLRYWDGRTWTRHVADAGVASTDPV